jgi:hypothetical protein
LFIEIPTGSYRAVFRWHDAAHAAIAPDLPTEMGAEKNLREFLLDPGCIFRVPGFVADALAWRY